MKQWLALGMVLLGVACAPPKPQLKDLKTARLSVQRQNVEPLTVGFIWDTNVVPCDSIAKLSGVVDGQAVSTFAGEFVWNRADDSGFCRFPSFELRSLDPGAHTLGFRDDTGELTMSVSLLESGGAAALTPMPDDLLAGTEVAWLFTLPPELISSWSIRFREQTWAEGFGPATQVRATVPSVTDPSLRAGPLTLAWRVAAIVTDCKLAQECRAEVSGKLEREVHLGP